MFMEAKRFSALPLAAAVVLTAGAILFSGCGGDDGGTDGKVAVKPKPAKDKTTDGGKTDGGAAKPKPANQTAFPKDKAVGQVAGNVVFDAAAGKAPKRGTIDISSKEECTKLHDGAKTVPDESVVIDEDGGIRNIFVYVSEGLEQYTFEPATDAVVLDQKGCVYVPHVFGLRVGQTLTVKNSDPLTHNVHYFAAKHPEMNISQGAGRSDDVKSFNKEDEVFAAVKCDVHSWMKAYMGVVDHPGFAVSGEKGGFSLPIKLPAGKYKLTARHETGRNKSVEVTVAADGKVTPEKIEFKFTRKELTGGN